ncbi:MAG TPA: hypothetical protein VF756_17655 [Thermoanaerobaculia bacterium]
MSESTRSGHRWTAGWMLAVGLLATATGVQGAWAWGHIENALRAYIAVSLVAGLALLASGASNLAARSRKRAAFVAGVVAALALGVNQALGVWLQIIPCYTPG